MARCFIFQADAQKISTQDDCTVPTFKRKKKPPSFTTSESYKLTDEFKIHGELQGFCHEFKRLCSEKIYHQLLPKNKIPWKNLVDLCPFCKKLHNKFTKSCSEGKNIHQLWSLPVKQQKKGSYLHFKWSQILRSDQTPLRQTQRSCTWANLHTIQTATAIHKKRVWLARWFKEIQLIFIIRIKE